MAEVLVALGGDGNIGDQPSQRLVVREPLMVLLLFLVAVAIEVGFGTCGNDLYKMALTRKVNTLCSTRFPASQWFIWSIGR